MRCMSLNIGYEDRCWRTFSLRSAKSSISTHVICNALCHVSLEDVTKYAIFNCQMIYADTSPRPAINALYHDSQHLKMSLSASLVGCFQWKCLWLGDSSSCPVRWRCCTMEGRDSCKVLCSLSCLSAATLAAGLAVGLTLLVGIILCISFFLLKRRCATMYTIIRGYA